MSSGEDTDQCELTIDGIAQEITRRIGDKVSDTIDKSLRSYYDQAKMGEATKNCINLERQRQTKLLMDELFPIIKRRLLRVQKIGNPKSPPKTSDAASSSAGQVVAIVRQCGTCSETFDAEEGNVRAAEEEHYASRHADMNESLYKTLCSYKFLSFTPLRPCGDTTNHPLIWLVWSDLRVKYGTEILCDGMRPKNAMEWRWCFPSKATRDEVIARYDSAQNDATTSK